MLLAIISDHNRYNSNMQSAKTQRSDWKSQPNLEAYALSPSLFQKNKKMRQHGLFLSDTGYRSSVTDNFNDAPDYTKLINDGYPKKIYARFLNIIINTPNIVIEEDSLKKVAQDVRNDPWKRYSIPTDLHTEFNIESVTNTNVSPKDPPSVNSDTNFSMIIGNDTEILSFKISTKNEQPSFLTIDHNDPEYLTDNQLQRLIELKMKQLDQFNSKLENRDVILLTKKYKLDSKRIELIRKLQLRIKFWIIKKKFFKAIRMNQYIEQKRNYLALKKSLTKFESRNKGGRYSDYYKSVVNYVDEK